MTYTDEQINTWPDHSYAGHERNLCDMLTEDAIDYMSNALEFATDDNETETACYQFFLLLMMNEPAFLALTEDDLRENYRLALQAYIKNEANDESGQFFTARLLQRITIYKTLIRLTEHFRSGAYKTATDN